MIVGAPDFGDHPVLTTLNMGAAQIYEFPWTPLRCSYIESWQVTKQSERFGFAVDIESNGDWVIGAPYHDVGSATGRGVAYISGNSVSGMYYPDDPAALDLFGYAVSIKGRFVLVGAPRHEHPLPSPLSNRHGSAYLFQPAAPAGFQQTHELLASDRANDDWFGCAVDFFFNFPYRTALVGARNNGRGAGYYYWDEPWIPEIPSLSAVGLAALGLVVIVAGVVVLRRRALCSGTRGATPA